MNRTGDSVCSCYAAAIFGVILSRMWRKLLSCVHPLSVRLGRSRHGLTTVLVSLCLTLPGIAHAQNDADDTAGMAVTLDEADLSGSNLTRDEASRLLA